LDERMGECERFRGETKCRLSREERAILGADLPSGGLWPREIIAKEHLAATEGIP